MPAKIYTDKDADLSVLGGVMPWFKSWSPRSTRRNDAASTGSALPPNPRLPGCRRASRSITRSRMSLRLGIAEPE